jgi:hypothetical protein
MTVLQFPKVKKSKNPVLQPLTTIMIVDFKKKELVGEMEIDNQKQMVVGQWGKKPVRQKKVA